MSHKTELRKAINRALDILPEHQLQDIYNFVFSRVKETTVEVNEAVKEFDKIMQDLHSDTDRP